MAPSPTKGKAARRLSRNTAEVAREICAAIQDIYYETSKDSVKKRTNDLFSLYKQEKDVMINKEEFLTELAYRTELFLGGAKCHEGQLRCFRMFAWLCNSSCFELKDNSIVEALAVSIHKKKFHQSALIRNATVALIGRILYAAVNEQKEGEIEDMETMFASNLPKKVFAEFYQILWHLSADVDEDVRVGVLIAIERVQRYPGLMLAVDTTKMETSKQLFVLGIRDPSPQVRCQAVRGLKVDVNGEARLLLDTLMNDASEDVRVAIAKKLSNDVPISFFSKNERANLIKCRNLFLSDTIIDDYYEILYSWACDVYAETHSIDYDIALPLQQVLHGVYDLLDSFRNFNKELSSVFSRLFEYLRKKFNLIDDDSGVINFSRMFIFDRTPYLNNENYEELLNLDIDFPPSQAMNHRIKKLFMWQTLSEYCCHPSLPENVRFDCQATLLPTMAEFAKFVPSVWDTLKSSDDVGLKQTMGAFQNICAKNLLNIFHSLDRDEIGMKAWEEVLYNLLFEYSFQYDSDLICLLVHDLFYYHHNAKEDPDAAVHYLSDLMAKIGDLGQKFDCTQDLYPSDTSQFNSSQMPSSQHSTDTQLENVQVSGIEPKKRKRCVQVLASIFKNGFFLTPNLVLEGLLTDYAIYTFDNPVDAESKSEAFVCIAGMLPLMDQNKYNFLKSSRVILDDHDQTDQIKTIALSLINDAIAVYGYSQVNQWYFIETENESTSQNKLIDKLIELSEEPNLVGPSAVRLLLRLIIFDHKKIYADAFIHLLLKLFKPGENEKIKILLVYFFINYCHYSRQHQCNMATAFCDAIMKLVDMDLDLSFSNVNKQEMATFVLQITSFNALHPKATDRELGSSHLFFASRLITRIEKVSDDKEFVDFLGMVLQKCEVSEVFDAVQFENVRKGCIRLHEMIGKSNVKKNIESFKKKLESAKKHSESKKAIERPDVSARKNDDKDGAFRALINMLKSNTEETNAEKRGWLLQEEPKEAGILSEMKIFGEIEANVDEIRQRLISQDSPLFLEAGEPAISTIRRPTPRRRGAVTPVFATPRTRILKSEASPSTRTLRRRPLKEKTLVVVPEEEDFAN